MTDFTYSDVPQRSPEWFEIRLGKVSASRLADWLAVSKAKTGAGKPLKARLDYEKELRFERQFNTNFNNYISDAMQDGIDFEAFAATQYEKITGNVALECGCWYNGSFVASPDRTVGDDGLVEIKVVRDNTFTEILISGVPDKHYKQIQGQLWASSRKWCDYTVLNLNTKKVLIIHVVRDEELIEYIEAAVQETLVQEEFTTENMHDVIGELPDWSREPATLGESVDNKFEGRW